MKALVITSFVLSIVLLIVLRLYVIWWNKQPYCPRDEKTQRRCKVRNIIANCLWVSVFVFFTSFVIWGIMWLWTNADVRVFVF